MYPPQNIQISKHCASIGCSAVTETILGKILHSINIPKIRRGNDCGPMQYVENISNRPMHCFGQDEREDEDNEQFDDSHMLRELENERHEDADDHSDHESTEDDEEKPEKSYRDLGHS